MGWEVAHCNMCTMSSIHSVAVLGAGTMGAQIAAHFANAGTHVVLLDVTAELAREGLKRARALKPDPFFTADAPALITTGSLDADLSRLADVDWILEAVIEQLDGRRAQVFVESMIVEMDAQKAAEFGFQWQGLLGRSGGRHAHR